MAFDRLNALRSSRFSPRFVLGGAVGLAMLLAAFEGVNVLLRESVPEVVLGLQGSTDYLRSHLGQLELAMEEIEVLPTGSRIQFLWEPRSFYCPATAICEPDALLDRWWHQRQQLRDAGAIAQAWQQAGITHVLIFHLGADSIRAAQFDPFVDADWQMLDRFVESELEPVSQPPGDYGLYQWRPDDGG